MLAQALAHMKVAIVATALEMPSLADSSPGRRIPHAYAATAGAAARPALATAAWPRPVASRPADMAALPASWPGVVADSAATVGH